MSRRDGREPGTAAIHIGGVTTHHSRFVKMPGCHRIQRVPAVAKLWKRMPAERRTQAAELFWDDEQSAEQQVEACATIATQMKFRAKSVLDLPVEKKTRYLVTLPNVSDAVAARALVNYHLGPAAADDGRLPRRARRGSRRGI